MPLQEFKYKLKSQINKDVAPLKASGQTLQRRMVWLSQLCLLTSEVRAICQLHFFTGLGDNTSNTMLNEVHFLPHSSFSNDVVSRLEHLKSQLAQHGRHKIGIRISKKRHCSHQFTAVEVDYFLKVSEHKRRGN